MMSKETAKDSDSFTDEEKRRLLRLFQDKGIVPADESDPLVGPSDNVPPTGDMPADTRK